MDNFEKKYIKYKTKYINLQNGGKVQFMFIISKSISPRELINFFSSEIVNENSISIQKGDNPNLTILIDLIQQNKFIVFDHAFDKKREADISEYNVSALETARQIKTFSIYRNTSEIPKLIDKQQEFLDSLPKGKRELFDKIKRDSHLLEVERDKKKAGEVLTALEKFGFTSNGDDDINPVGRDLCFKLNNLVDKIKMKLVKANDLPKHLNLIITTIQQIKSINSDYIDLILGDKIKFYFNSSSFKQQIEEIMGYERGKRHVIPFLCAIQELVKKIGNEFDLKIDVEVVMPAISAVTGEDFAFDMQLNDDFESLINPNRPGGRVSITEALRQIMVLRNAHVYSQLEEVDERVNCTKVDYTEILRQIKY